MATTGKTNGKSDKPVRRAPTHSTRGSTIFISYRRADSLPTAAYLHACLRQHFGAGAVFRDEDSIKPGEDFPAAIEREIRTATAVIVIIGRRWLKVRSKAGQPRLFDPEDFVRREIELAIAARRQIIPVLIDGVTMPTKDELPPAIAALARSDAIDLPWNQGIAQITRRVKEIEREFSDDFRVDVGMQAVTSAAARSDAALFAMQLSLGNQGVRNVKLDSREFRLSLKRLADFDLGDVVLFPDLIYILDLVGVGVVRRPQRYVARSRAVRDLDDVPSFLRQRIPILAGLNAKEGWFRPPVTVTGIDDSTVEKPIAGGFLAVLTDWNPRSRMFTVDTRHAMVGKAGVLKLSYEVARQCVDKNELRAIDAAEAPHPVSLKAEKHFNARLTPLRAKSKKA